MAAVDWSRWRACPICRAALGQPCRSRSGRIVDGQPDGVVTVLERPHVRRPARSVRGVASGVATPADAP